MLDVGIVGCGLIGDVHAWALKALRDAGVCDVRVTLVHDADEQRAKAFAARHRAAPADLDELLGSVGAVWVCTPTAAHAAAVEAAVARGVPVYCEKPLAPTLVAAGHVAAELERIPHQVGLVLRSSPTLRRLADVLAAGTYGRPMTFVLRDDQFFPIQGHYASTWRAEVAAAGGGTLIEHSIHDLDVFRWLFGPAASVAATRASFFGYPGVEDLATAVLGYEDGRTATLVSVWHQVMSRGSSRRFEVFCEDAFLWIEDRSVLGVQTSERTEHVECRFDDWVERIRVPEDVRLSLAIYADADKRFCDLVTSGAGDGPRASDALRAHELVDAAYRSADARGAPVAV